MPIDEIDDIELDEDTHPIIAEFLKTRYWPAVNEFKRLIAAYQAYCKIDHELDLPEPVELCEKLNKAEKKWKYELHQWELLEKLIDDYE